MDNILNTNINNCDRYSNVECLKLEKFYCNVTCKIMKTKNFSKNFYAIKIN